MNKHPERVYMYVISINPLSALENRFIVVLLPIIDFYSCIFAKH